MMCNNVEIGKRIETRRKELNLTLGEVARSVGVAVSTIQRYEKGSFEKIKLPIIEAIASCLKVNPMWISGHTDDPICHNNLTLPSNLRPLRKVHYIPRIGRIACGLPILAEENIQGHVLLPDGVKADFALDCTGDSMIEACISDGDTVFIRAQPEVENGEIAAVLINEEATLKRIYLNSNVLTLMPANKEYMPLSFAKDEMDSVRILGKATAVLKLL